MFLPQFKRCVCSAPGILKLFYRSLNSSQTATALRPFYFAVHPDLFGRHPKERSVNEESLKILHEYVASLHTHRTYSLQPIDLTFYIRNPNNHEDFRNIKISLKSADIRTTVSTILKACGLPLDYLQTVPVSVEQNKYKIDWITPRNIHEADLHENRTYTPSPKKTLRRWLEDKQERVQQYVEASQQAQTEIDALCARIVSQVGVKSVRWENIWGNRHYIACLRTFNQLSENQLGRMRNTMRGRTLVFGNVTGVNLHGEVVLGSEDVTTDWMMVYCQSLDVLQSLLTHC